MPTSSAKPRKRSPRKFTPPVREDFLKVLRETGNLKVSAAAVGVSANTVHEAKCDPAFAARCDDAVRAVPRAKRVTKRRTWRGLFLEKLRELGSTRLAAAAAGISKTHVIRTRATDREFKAAADEAKRQYRQAQETETPVDRVASHLLRIEANRREIERLERACCALEADVDQLTAGDPAILPAARRVKIELEKGQAPGGKGDLLARAREFVKTLKGPTEQATRRKRDYYISQLSAAFKRAGARNCPDLTRAAMERFRAASLAEVRPGTYQSAFTCIRNFCKWATDQGYLLSDPSSTLRYLPAAAVEAGKGAQVHIPSERTLEQFLAKTAQSEYRAPSGATGRDRAELHLATASTGLMPSELRGLTVGQFDTESDPPVVRVSATRVVPILPASAATSLREYFRNKSRSDPAFTIPPTSHELLANFDRDLAAARIEPTRVLNRGTPQERREMFCLRSFQYAFVAGCVASRHPVPTVAQWLGRRDSRALARLYERIAPGLIAELSIAQARQAVEARPPKPGPPPAPPVAVAAPVETMTPKATRSPRGGRPKVLSAEEERRRIEIFEAWELAEPTHTRQEFCDSRRIDVGYLELCRGTVTKLRQRGKRKAG